MCAIVLGLTMGILSVGFVATHAIVTDYWFHYDPFENSTVLLGDDDGTVLDDDDSFLFFPSSLGHHWTWIVMSTVGGGFLSGILLLIINEANLAGSSGGLELLLHRTSSTVQEGSILSMLCHDFLLVFCSLAALSAGIPLGMCFCRFYVCLCSFCSLPSVNLCTDI